jgi:hypothetical protein
VHLDCNARVGGLHRRRIDRSDADPGIEIGQVAAIIYSNQVVYAVFLDLAGEPVGITK